MLYFYRGSRCSAIFLHVSHGVVLYFYRGSRCSAIFYRGTRCSAIFFTEGHGVVLYFYRGSRCRAIFLHVHAKFEMNYFLSAWMVWFLFMVYDWCACVSIVLYCGSFSAL